MTKKQPRLTREEMCAERVFPDIGGDHQCNRRGAHPAANGLRYCAQHHPDLIAKRRAASDERSAKRRAASDRLYEARARERETREEMATGLAVWTDTVGGHNDAALRLLGKAWINARQELYAAQAARDAEMADARRR